MLKSTKDAIYRFNAICILSVYNRGQLVQAGNMRRENDAANEMKAQDDFTSRNEGSDDECRLIDYEERGA